jgi:hypothetical protein
LRLLLLLLLLLPLVLATRAAMLGYAGMLLTEAVTGVNTLQAWGLQPMHWTGHL